MAKSKEVKFIPTDEDTKAMNICFKNDLAYVLKPSKNANRYNVIKYQISNYKEVFYLKENNVNVEFTEEEGLKKTMELYKFHAKRFTK
jgi:phenolic acid decarboxylase